MMNNSAAVNSMGGTLGLGVAGAGPGISDGLGSALGLGGGAGLLGLGAAIMAIFGHHTTEAIDRRQLKLPWEKIIDAGQAPFTRDPNEIQRTREYMFYSPARKRSRTRPKIFCNSHTI